MSIIFSSNNYRMGKRGWSYSALLHGQAMVANREAPVNVEVIPLTYNDRASWQSATSSNDGVDCRIYEVTIQESEDFDSAVENLKYFFIRADRAYKAHEQRKMQFGLLVHVAGRHQFRLRTWLAMISGKNPRYNLLYCVDTPSAQDAEKWCYPIEPPEHAEKEKRNPAGRMMPLLRIVDHGESASAGDVEISTLFSTEPHTASNLTGVKLSKDDIEEYCTKEHNTWDLRWWDSVQELCKVFLVRIAQNVIGTPENPLTQEGKMALRQGLFDFIISKRPHMTFFSELCWFFNLQYLMETKKIISNENRLNTVVLQQSYLDAITYTDGVLQLLENSCQHSQLKSAYLGLRMHHVDRSGTDIQLFETIRNRQKLVTRYGRLSGSTWSLELNAKYYMEISVTDDSYVSKNRRKGILETYCDNALQRYPAESPALPETLKDIFTNKALPMASSDDGVVHHYGIPALRQLVLQNHGVFLVSSPHTDCTEIVKITQNGEEYKTREELYRDLKWDTVPELDETSEYHILFPLGLYEKKLSQQTPDNWASIFETSNLCDITTSNVKTKIYNLQSDLEALAQNTLFLTQPDKIACVNNAVKSFSSKLTTIPDIDNCILLFDLRNINGLQMELFAKFLFRIILNEGNSRRLYAVYFDDPLKQQEFIRLFAIFYERIKSRDKEKNSGSGTQIALCSTSQDLNVPEVNLILNMADWNSLLESARRSAYCNLESSQDVYSQIKYLARNELNQSTGIPMFPFDLYLTTSMPENEETASPAEDNEQCWFLRRISSLLQCDLQQERMGIKIQDVHTYLPSNVHLGSFYEAEQLFHNAEYVSRFAYLIAQRLLRDGYTGKKYLIVCYEAYSALLGQYLADYLVSALGSTTHVEYAIMYQEKKGHTRLVMPPSLSENPDEATFFEDCNFICLCPIGTTLSTIHTMHDRLVRETKKPIHAKNMRDLVLILVTEDKKPSDIQHRYWHAYGKDVQDARGGPSARQQGRVKLFGGYNESEWNVDFFLEAKTTWHDPEDCASFDDERALVHVDATSTELNMVFPIKGLLDSPSQEAANWENIHQHDVCSFIAYKYKEINNKRLQLLKDCVYYGHLSQGNNHYGFYLDLARYYEKIKLAYQNDESSYEAWLRGLRKLRINKDAFNIIVSPLRNGRSSLLKDIIGSVFEHSMHILQLDLHNSRRTDIRTKYGYITRECNELRKNDPSAKINVYYVDDSIVSAETLHRGRSLVQMLIGNCISTEDNNFLYTGVFVLINRSSKDTVRTFVKDPARDFHSFVHLAVPHYNTRKDRCPACERIEKYHQLILRSTTNHFAEEYQRLSEKHKLRTLEEYKQWQKHHLFHSPDAFLRLRQWVFNQCINNSENVPEEINQVKSKLDEIKAATCQLFYRTHKKSTDGSSIDVNDINYQSLLAQLLKNNEALQQKFLEELEQKSLSDQLSASEKADSNLCKAFETVWMKYVLQDKAYRRLMSAHRAYCMLPLEIEPVIEKDKITVPDSEYMRKRILQYLKPDDSCKTDFDRWEYILSGLKVVSRDYLARHHLLRESVFYILRGIADTLQGNMVDNQEISNLLRMGKRKKVVQTLEETSITTIDPLLRYQMLQSILHRLSDMESNYAILALADGTLLEKLRKHTETFFVNTGNSREKVDRWFFCTLPSYEKMLFDFGKSIKLSTMSQDEENKSMLIQNVHRHASNHGLK